MKTPLEYIEHAYEDIALPNEKGQTVSQPSTIAIMLSLLEAGKGMKVLEVGSGSGYVVALLSKIVGEKGKVFGIEFHRELAEKSIASLHKEGIRNFEVKACDGAEGWNEKAPFDMILVSCACPFIPKELFRQLKEGGRVVAPVGDAGVQMMETLIKKDGKPVKKTYYGTTFVFVPLLGRKRAG